MESLLANIHTLYITSPLGNFGSEPWATYSQMIPWFAKPLVCSFVSANLKFEPTALFNCVAVTTSPQLLTILPDDVDVISGLTLFAGSTLLLRVIRYPPATIIMMIII